MNFSDDRDPRESTTPSLGEVHFHVEFVDGHPILEVAIEPVGFLDQHRANQGVRLQIGHHLIERGAARLLGRFNVDIFLRDLESVRRGVLLQELQLRRDREALLLLLLGGHARVDNCLTVSGRGGGGRLGGLFHTFSFA